MPTLSPYSFHKNYDNFFESVQSTINCNFSGFKTSENKKSISIELEQPLRIDAEEIAIKHIKPGGIIGVEILIDFRIRFDILDYIDLYQNTISSNFNVTIRAIGENGTNYKGFHFDFENSFSDDNQPHPQHHCQFLLNPKEVVDFNYGNTLQLDIPRFTHFPMELILGTSFILSNFSPNAFKDLQDNRIFAKLRKDYQTHYWKPYIQKLNAFLESNPDEIESARQIQPYWMI